MGYFHRSWAAMPGRSDFGHLPDCRTGMRMAMNFIAGVSIVMLAYIGGRAERV
jgi:hypothetical protein